MNTDLAVACFCFMTVYFYVGGTAAGYAYPFSWEQLLRGRSEVEAAIQWAREAKLLPEPYLHGLSIVFFSMVEVP